MAKKRLKIARSTPIYPIFITGIRIKEDECAFFLNISTLMFPVEKMHSSPCFIQNWEEIESFKNEKSPRIVRTTPVKRSLSKHMFKMMEKKIITVLH